MANETQEDFDVFFDDLEVDHVYGPVVQQDDYTPFGGTFNSYTSGTENLYKYNGKEEQKALGIYDYGARYFDPSIARFTTIDPLAEINYSVSPYAYVNNNPISNSDPTGMFDVNSNCDLTSTFVGPDGKVIEHRDDGDPLVYHVGDPSSWNGSKDGLGVLGFEDPLKTYKKGDKYEQYYPSQNAQSSHAAAWSLATTVSSGLVADDATGVGTADDVVIPIWWAGTLVYVLLFSDDRADPVAVPIDATADRQSATVIFIDGNMSPEAAQHGYDAIKSGVVNIGTLDRAGGSGRRVKNLAASGLPTMPGKDRDEFLPSILIPSGRVSVRSIDFRDNRSAGGQIRAQLLGVEDGTTVIVIPINVPRK